MDTKCPHCRKTIDLVGAKELKDDYGIGPNSVAHARSKGTFPEPWLVFQNRLIWLRSAIEEYVEGRSKRQVEDNVAKLLKALDNLPEADQVEAKKALAEKLGVG